MSLEIVLDDFSYGKRSAMTSAEAATLSIEETSTTTPLPPRNPSKHPGKSS